MYKDPDRQREAVKLATRRYRARGSRKVSQATRAQPGTSRVSQVKSVIPIQQAAQTQSYNPMMVGYVPPK